MAKKLNCPCHSGRPYRDCCGHFHAGKKVPESAVELMRSRYSAYARGAATYIIATTHPEHQDASKDPKQWEKEILAFSKSTLFKGLIIRDQHQVDDKAWVTFTAQLIQAGEDSSFTEKSFFERLGGRWFYHSGEMQ